MKKENKMWSDIAISVATSIGEALCTNLVKKKKSEMLNKQITKVIYETLNEFSDSSLDCSDFYQLVQSSNFKNLLRDYYCSIYHDLCNNHANLLEEYILHECPNVDPINAKRFVQVVTTVYENDLRKIISQDQDINALFQAMNASNKYLVEQLYKNEENLKKYIDSLIGKKTKIDDSKIIEYHKVCETNYNQIKFTGMAGVEQKKNQDINSYYVKNTFSYYDHREFFDKFDNNTEKVEEIALKDFFKINNKIVLIGAAGLGKSTTLNYLFCNYETLYDDRPLKIKINLKDYAKELTDSDKDLLWCLATDFKKKTKRVKADLIDIETELEKYLESGKCLVILDALDEIPTQSAREDVRTEIANFCELYYLNRFIISTREVGYLKNRFDDSFFHIRINSFNDFQIREYSKKWYYFIHQKNDDSSFLNKFSKEVARANCETLIRNPIILVLALNIFDVEKCLPNRRVEFYRECVETFLTLRESRKNVVELSNKVKNILNSSSVLPGIANYMYSMYNDKENYRFSFDELKKSVFFALEIDDELTWGTAVIDYLDYLVNRTELISEKDENVFDFAHKTFYEYFLAVYFAKEYQVDKLILLLQKWIGDSNYDELARLIIEVVIQKDDHYQHNELILFLLDYTDNNDKAFEKLSILEELYSSNLLGIKYHSQYFKLILKMASIQAPNSMTRRWFYANVTSEVCDIPSLAKLFCNNYISDCPTFENYHTLFCLGDNFRISVAQETNDTRTNSIATLFSYASRRGFKADSSDYISNREINNIIDYFLNSELDLVLDNPFVFLSIALLISRYRATEYISKLFEYRFDSCDLFFYFFTYYSDLKRLVIDGSLNADSLLLLLIVLIHCNDYDYSVVLRTIKNDNPILDECLFQCKSFESRISLLEKKKLYIPEQSHLYIELFNEFDKKSYSKDLPK